MFFETVKFCDWRDFQSEFLANNSQHAKNQNNKRDTFPVLCCVKTLKYWEMLRIRKVCFNTRPNGCSPHFIQLTHGIDSVQLKKMTTHKTTHFWKLYFVVPTESSKTNQVIYLYDDRANVIKYVTFFFFGFALSLPISISLRLVKKNCLNRMVGNGNCYWL